MTATYTFDVFSQPRRLRRCHRRLDRLLGCRRIDLELLEHRTLDGHIQELVYRPALH